MKLYNTATDKSNFPVTVHAQNLMRESPGISVYGDQSPTEVNTDELYKNSKKFVGLFKELELDVTNSGNNQCKYLLVSGKLWSYVYVKIFDIREKNNVKVCEVIFN